MYMTELLLFIGLLSAVFGCHVQLLNLMQQRRLLDEQRSRLLLLLATPTATFSRRQQRRTYCCCIWLTRILHHLVAELFFTELFLLHHLCGWEIYSTKPWLQNNLVWCGQGLRAACVSVSWGHFTSRQRGFILWALSFRVVRPTCGSLTQPAYMRVAVIPGGKGKKEMHRFSLKVLKNICLTFFFWFVACITRATNLAIIDGRKALRLCSNEKLDVHVNYQCRPSRKT